MASRYGAFEVGDRDALVEERDHVMIFANVLTDGVLVVHTQLREFWRADG